MVVFEETALSAASLGADECTSTLVALPDCTLHGGRDMATGGVSGWRSRPIDGRVSALAQLGEQRFQRTLEDRGDVAVGDAVAEQVLRLSQRVVSLARDGELHLVPFRGERLDLGSPYSRLVNSWCHHHVGYGARRCKRSRFGQVQTQACGGRRRSGRRQFSHRRRDFRLRPQRRDDFLNLPLALVPCSREHLAVIAFGEMRRKKTDRGQVEGTVRELCDDDRPLPRRPRRLDSKIRGVLRQVEDPRAVREER
jgi:hypothetical protein